MLFQTLYRAVVEPSTDAGAYVERIVFFQANSRDDAARKLTALIAAIDGVPEDQVSFYNLDSYQELVNNGVSENVRLRIFETGWQGLNVACWARNPLFLVRDPGPLFRLWSTLPAED